MSLCFHFSQQCTLGLPSNVFRQIIECIYTVHDMMIFNFLSSFLSYVFGPNRNGLLERIAFFWRIGIIKKVDHICFATGAQKQSIIVDHRLVLVNLSICQILIAFIINNGPTQDLFHSFTLSPYFVTRLWCPLSLVGLLYPPCPSILLLILSMNKLLASRATYAPIPWAIHLYLQSNCRQTCSMHP